MRLSFGAKFILGTDLLQIERWQLVLLLTGAQFGGCYAAPLVLESIADLPSRLIT